MQQRPLRCEYGSNRCPLLVQPGTWKGFPNWTFRRGLDGPTQNYPDCTAVSGFILAAFVNNNTPENDMGALKVNCSVPGSFGNGYYPLVAISLAVQTFIDGLYSRVPNLGPGNER